MSLLRRLQAAKEEVNRQRKILAASYGQHVPLRMQMESEILSQFRRLPSLQSSMVGLETLAGRDTKIDVTDVFGAVLSNITSQIPNRCCGALFRLCMLRQSVSAPCTCALRRHSRLAWCSDARRARHIIREIYVKVTLRRCTGDVQPS